MIGVGKTTCRAHCIVCPLLSCYVFFCPPFYPILYPTSLLSPYISVHALSPLYCLSGHFISYFVFSHRYFTIIFFSHICNLLAAKKFSVFSSPLFWNRVIWRHFLSLLDLDCRILLSRALSLTKCIFPPCQSGPSAISPMVLTLPPPPQFIPPCLFFPICAICS
jgi:hypothetical protein